METRVVIGRRRGGARRIPQPWGGTGNNPANDRAQTRDIGVALAVSELSARTFSVVAVGVSTATLIVGIRLTRARTHSSRTAAARSAVINIAVQVITRLGARRIVADTRAIGFPPARGNRPRRTSILAGQSTAELGVAVTTQRTTGARLARARADCGVRTDRFECEDFWCHHQCSRTHREPLQETAPIQVLIRQPRGNAIYEATHAILLGRTDIIT